MASPIKNVLLIGAGGNLGPSILTEFLASNKYNITVLSRTESTKTFPSEAKVIKSDFSPASLESAFKGQDAVISLVGTPGFAGQKALVDAAVAAGVKRFIPSEFGSDTASERVREVVPIFNGKRAIIEYAKTKEGSGFSWTGVITGPFFDWGFKTGFLGFNPKNKTAKIFDGGDVPFSGTNLRTIGKALVALLSTNELVEESKNEYIYVSSFTTTQNEILRIFESITGEKWKVEHAKTKPIQDDGLAKLGKGDYSAVPGLIQAAIFSDERLGDLGAKVWDQKLGLPKESLEGTLKAAL